MDLKQRLSFNLGLSIGENIFHTSLVRLVDNRFEDNSSLFIKMNEDDSKIIQNYENKIYKFIVKNNNFNDLHKEFVKVRREMVNKYLPKTLRCPIIKILPLDDDLIYYFKKGLQKFLWDCDICEYSIENIDDMVIEEGIFEYDFLILKLL